MEFQIKKVQMLGVVMAAVASLTMVSETYAAAAMMRGQGVIPFKFAGPGTMVVDLKDLAGEGYPTVYVDTSQSNGQDTVMMTCDDEPSVPVGPNQTRYCFDAKEKLTVTLEPKDYQFGSVGYIMRRVVG